VNKVAFDSTRSSNTQSSWFFEETDHSFLASLQASAAMERPYFKQPTTNVPALGDVVRAPPLSIQQSRSLLPH
jgi:hypothetical protein